VRLAWAVVWLLILPAFWGAPAYLWLVECLPWAVVGALLVRTQRAETICAHLTRLLSSVSAQRAVVLLAGVLCLMAGWFSPAAALTAFTWLAASIVVLTASERDGLASDLLLGVTTSGVALVLVLGGAELLFRTPMMQRRLGLPQELAAWPNRYDHLWDRNIFRFRSPYETIARKPGVHRILAVGDSFTWGDKITQTDSTWPADLERDFRGDFPGGAFEVINAARSGWTTANEGELLRRLGWQFNPDLVLLQFFPNDALESGPNFLHQDEQSLQPDHRLLPSLFRTGAIDSSAFFAYVEGQYNARRYPPPEKAWAGLYQDGKRGWQQLQASLREIGDSASHRHVPVLVVLFPTLLDGSWTAENYPMRPILEKVGGVARQSGLYVLDLTPIFAAPGVPWERWRALPYDGHTSAAADALVAHAVERYIVQHRLLPGTVAVTTPAEAASGTDHAAGVSIPRSSALRNAGQTAGEPR
jgi:hypothetical protein